MLGRHGGTAHALRLSIALSVVIGLIGVNAPRAAASYPYPKERVQFLRSLYPWNWYKPPEGANTGCIPPSSHPYPVVLAEGTIANMFNSFGALAPYLANAGYCVYAFNYGQTLDPSPFDATGDIVQSARQLASEVQFVLARTGARKVDIVGWSQGGMMPRYYIDDLGGSQYVRRLIALAPSNHGSTADGITNLLGEFSLLGLVDGALAPSCAACTEQVSGSSFLRMLNAGGGTAPSTTYINIASKHDDVVTPYTSAFLSGPNVQNVTIQNQCPQDASGHLAIPYDANILQDVVNALGPDSPKFHPRCSATGQLSGNL